jgi:hypothetical protein
VETENSVKDARRPIRDVSSRPLLQQLSPQFRGIIPRQLRVDPLVALTIVTGGVYVHDVLHFAEDRRTNVHHTAPVHACDPARRRRCRKKLKIKMGSK